MKLQRRNVITVSIIFTIFLTKQCRSVKFVDITRRSGLPSQSVRKTKYGGACITDLDLDGLPDLILFHHTNCCATIHFNNGPLKKFTEAEFKFSGDLHAIVPFIPTPSHTTPYISISVGGSSGKVPKVPLILHISKERKVRYVENKTLYPISVAGRGRTVVMMRLRRSDVKSFGALILNAPPANSKFKKTRHNTAVEWSNGRFKKRGNSLGQLASNRNHYAGLTDIDNDGVMEVLIFEEFRMYNLTSDYKFKEISKQVRIPVDHSGKRGSKSRYLRAVSSMAEIDYNNDGLWDLYLTRSSKGDLRWLSDYLAAFNSPADVLLKNIGGVYEDITMPNELAGSNFGVAAGDFNNDGYIDLYVSSQSKRTDFLLMNDNGNKFNIRKIRRRTSGPGDMATAVDIDNNGYMDLLVSTGHWHLAGQRGAFSLLRNSGVDCYRNFIHVKVGNSPKRQVTALHAVVKVKVKSIKGVMMRRVGGSAGVGTGVSVLNILHFGMRNQKRTEWISVTWVNGEKRWFIGSRSRSMIIA